MVHASAPQLAQTKGNATNRACCIVGTPNDASAWVMGPCNPARSAFTVSERIGIAGKQICVINVPGDGMHVSRPECLCVQGASSCEQASTMQ